MTFVDQTFIIKKMEHILIAIEYRAYGRQQSLYNHMVAKASSLLAE